MSLNCLNNNANNVQILPHLSIFGIINIENFLLTTNKTPNTYNLTSLSNLGELNKIERETTYNTVTQTIEHQREKLPLQHFCAGYERNLTIISISLEFANLENNP